MGPLYCAAVAGGIPHALRHPDPTQDAVEETLDARASLEAPE